VDGAPAERSDRDGTISVDFGIAATRALCENKRVMGRRESNGIRPSAREPRRVVFLATPCSAGVDLIGALDLLTVTNTLLRTMGRGPAYAPEVVAAEPGAVTTWPGLQLVVERPYTSVMGRIDTLIVGAVDDPDIAGRDRRPSCERAPDSSSCGLVGATGTSLPARWNASIGYTFGDTVTSSDRRWYTPSADPTRG